MKALQINGYGGSEVMVINEEVVAPVVAAGVVIGASAYGLKKLFE